ncbi:MAG: hypothetical protein PHT80_00520 [Lentisphaeria bacterium]|nr:hypothetical protein [Lentisphaeria bacterium]
MRFLIASMLVLGAVCRADLHFENDVYSVSLREADGAILSIVDKAGGTTAAGGDSLWRLDFETETFAASAFMAAPWNGVMQSHWHDNGDRLTLQYHSDVFALTVHIAFAASHFDLSAEIVRSDRPIMRLFLPDQISFPTAGMARLVFPARATEALGYAFLPAFYGDHHAGNSQQFTRVRCGGMGYQQLYGGPLRQLDDKQPQAPLTATAEGRKWFSPEAIAAIEGKLMSVNRPPAESQYTLSLLENSDGPALSAHDFGGKGLLFRIAGLSAEGMERGKNVFISIMTATMQGYICRHPSALKGRKIAIIALRNGPLRGGGTAPTVDDWRLAVANPAILRPAGAELAVIESAAQMRDALAGDDVGMILNPYGEWFPSDDAKQLTADLALLRDYVRRGGIWWEVGSHPFYYALAPTPYLSHSVQYPNGSADFMYVDYSRGGIALFGIQPMMRQPWDSERLATPCSLKTWGDPAGAAVNHGWNDAIEPGMTWRSPVYRCHFGFATPQAALNEYARVNEIGGSLNAKVRNPELLEKLKNAMLLRVGGATADSQIQALADVPAPNIIHFTEYLRGGFDKQYPDHLPPKASWGTSEDLTRFYRVAHERGHLMMPYTNTSWWSIDPKGPTFEREGEAPLTLTREGQFNREYYGSKVGYSICFWHPAVQASHRQVRHDLSVTYPSDILFQDQVGARPWHWNYHPLEPRKASTRDGMHSLSMEDAEHVPLATEDGHDRVVNFETMLCGCAWGTIPARGQYSTLHARFRFPENEWEFFPILSYLGHQQCLFTTHDLGHFIEEPDQLSHALAFGYSMSYRWTRGYEKNPARKRWLHWLDAIQKSVAADYAGRKLLDFSYPRAQLGLSNPHQVTCTRFAGDIVVIANLEDTPCELTSILATIALPDNEKRWLEQHTLPPYGFYVCSPRAKAASLQTNDGSQYMGFALAFKNQRLCGVMLGEDHDSLTAVLPAAWLAGVDALISEDDRRIALKVSNGAGDGNGAASFSWHAADPATPLALPKTAPAHSDDAPRHVAVLALAGVGDDTYRSTVKRWLDELPAQFARSGLNVSAIRTPAELVAALTQPPGKERPFAIISPDGEAFSGDANMTAKDMLALMLGYVRTGGIWWQTGGGYPLYIYRTLQNDGSWQTVSLRDGGANSLGFTCASYAVSESARPLAVTAAGRQWLDPARAAIIIAEAAGVQRPIVANDNPLVLVKAQDRDDGFLEAVRCGGTGFFFHLGGFKPPWASAINSVGATIEYLFFHPWPEPDAAKTAKLWRIAQK